jgi:hypothetical protein
MATATTVRVDEPSIDPESITHDDIVLLTAYMAEEGYPASEVAYAVEKPWKYIEELVKAQAERDEEGSREILPLEQQYPKTVQS